VARLLALPRQQLREGRTRSRGGPQNTTHGAVMHYMLQPA
jgi:hypothetical protein